MKKEHNHQMQQMNILMDGFLKGLQTIHDNIHRHHHFIRQLNSLNLPHTIHKCHYILLCATLLHHLCHAIQAHRCHRKCLYHQLHPLYLLHRTILYHRLFFHWKFLHLIINCHRLFNKARILFWLTHLRENRLLLTNISNKSLYSNIYNFIYWLFTLVVVIMISYIF